MQLDIINPIKLSRGQEAMLLKYEQCYAHLSHKLINPEVRVPGGGGVEGPLVTTGSIGVATPLICMRSIMSFTYP